MTVALALAFDHLTPKCCHLAGRIVPGPANTTIADWLREHASDFEMILTQEAIFVAIHIALQPPGRGDLLLANATPDGTPFDGTPIYRMHKHDPDFPIRTLPALRFAVDRLRTVMPDQIALIAHQAQYDRARKALKSLYKGDIVFPAGLPEIPYARPGARPRLRWAIREKLLARPIEAVQRRTFLYGKPTEVRLDEI